MSEQALPTPHRIGDSLEGILTRITSPSEKRVEKPVEHVDPALNPTRRRRWWRAAGGDPNDELSVGNAISARENVTITRA
jgi:hypothetical protein